MSDQVNELFAALSKFQGELGNVSKNKKATVNKQGASYGYADIGACIDAAKPHLVSNGLAVSQMIGMNEVGKQTLITILTHCSGQYMMSEFVMVEASLMGGAGNNPAQVLGSSITYQRRYAYAAIIGLAQEDNDAHGVAGKPKSNDDQLAWYNGFDNDKQGMIEFLAGGGTHQQIFDNLANQGLKLSKEVREKINNLTV